MKYDSSKAKEVKEYILDKLHDGNSLYQILKENKEAAQALMKHKGPSDYLVLPSRQTVYSWMNKENAQYDPEFLDNYTRARRDQADRNAEQIEDIANQVLQGDLKPDAARVAIDALKWTAGRKKPKRYGESILVEHEGSVKQKKTIEVVDLSALSPDQLKAYIALHGETEEIETDL